MKINDYMYNIVIKYNTTITTRISYINMIRWVEPLISESNKTIKIFNRMRTLFLGYSYKKCN